MSTVYIIPNAKKLLMINKGSIIKQFELVTPVIRKPET